MMGQNEREVINIREWSNFKKASIICQMDYWWDEREFERYDEDPLDEEAQEELIEFWEEQWTLVDSTIAYVDTEKGYYNNRTILRRNEDGKFFEHTWSSSYNFTPWEDGEMTELTEVFRYPSFKYR